MISRLSLCVCISVLILAGACSSESGEESFSPTRVVDLGILITPDLPERMWGRAFLQQMGFDRPNSFDVIEWEFPVGDGIVNGSNAYYTLFNHGGPHVDAPNHVGQGGGLDSYAIEDFAGPVRVFDARGYENGRTIPVEMFQDQVAAGDVVLIYTGYTPPQNRDDLPEHAAITNEAADYLASLPVRAFGTDSFSVDSLQDTSPPLVHDAFLGRGIPAYEQLQNLDLLLNESRMYFVGAPLNIQGGDGMVVRPVVFVY